MLLIMLLSSAIGDYNFGVRVAIVPLMGVAEQILFAAITVLLVCNPIYASV